MSETTQLIMIGTLHYDPRGKERVTRILERFQPTVVTVEGNTSQLRWEKTGKPAIVKETTRMLAKRGLTSDELMWYNRWEEKPHFEYSAAEAFSRERGIKFFPIDLFDGQEQVAWGKHLTSFAREASLSGIRYYIDPGNAAGIQKAVDEEYHGVCMSLNFYGTIIPEDDPDVGRRDIYMEAQIREIFRQHPETKMVHVGGTKHVFDDPWRRTLFSRLKDFSPRRHLLNEADKQPR